MKSPSCYCTSVNESENLVSVNEGKRCNTLWYHRLKKHTCLFFCLFIISAKVFQRSYDIFMQTRTCSYKPRNMLQPMPEAHKMLQHWTLFPLNLRCLVFPTMCFFIALGIHLSHRTVMARVSLSAGSNFTDLWWVRRFWFDQVLLSIIGLQHRRYNNPGLCSYRPHGVKNGLPWRYCLKKKKIEKKL